MKPEITIAEIEELVPGAGRDFTLHQSKERFTKVNGELCRVSRRLWNDSPDKINAAYEAAEFGLVRLKRQSKKAKFRLHEIHVVYARVENLASDL